MEGKLGLVYSTDCEALLSHLDHQQENLLLKRRWLIGLPLSKSHQRKLSEARYLPESFLREDDIFCEIVKQHVEKAFGSYNPEVEDQGQQTVHVLDKAATKRILISRPDALTNEGLYRIALLLTGGSVNFHTTRKKMKELIKGSLPKVLQDENHGVDILHEISRLLNNPRNVREASLMSLIPVYSHRATAIRVLNEIEEIPTEALLAMHRKLRGTPTGNPQLQPTRHGWSRDTLIRSVRKKSEKMLSNVGARDELPVSLAKALAIASLSSKLTLGRSSSSVIDFDQFSQATKRLQDELAKAILLVKTKVRLPELKALQVLLDPSSDVPNGSLRTSVKKMLTGYLFECGDIDTVPKPLLEALDIINRGSRVHHRSLSKEDIAKEVECILRLSAQTKQIVWDLLSDVYTDGDFTEAYIEELEESDEEDEDDGCGNDPDAFDVSGIAADEDRDQQFKVGRFWNRNYSDQEVCIGENIPLDTDRPTGGDIPPIHEVNPAAESIPSAPMNGERSSLHHVPKMTSNNSFSDAAGPEKNTEREVESPFCPMPNCNNSYKSFQQSISNNMYLGIQEACDATSIAAYNLIGRIMEGLANEDDLDLDKTARSYLRVDCSDQDQEEDQYSAGSNGAESVIIQAVKDLLPVLSKSDMDELKDILGI